jgi:anti-sigma regulatory factor (Ser/Thr protein kinase)
MRSSAACSSQRRDGQENGAAGRTARQYALCLLSEAEIEHSREEGRPAARTVLQLSLSMRRASARRLRASLSGYLGSNGVPRATVNEVLLAANEAFVNAFVHGGDVTGAVTVRAQVLDGRVLVEIRDRGCGFDTQAMDIVATPDPLVAHGRGLFLIYQLMDQVDVRSPGSGQGTLVSMAKSFSRRPSRVAESIR